MDLDQIDRTLARFHETVALVSTNLVELESDAVRMRLDQATLTGTTASRWAEAKLELGRLWQWFSQLNELLDRADRLRAQKGRVDDVRLSQLAALLATPSIELSTLDIPLSERGLLGARHNTVRCTPDDLLNSMTADFGEVAAVIGAAGQAWAAKEARLQVLDAELARTAAVASSLGAEHQAELDRLRARLGRLADAVASDPLSLDADGIEPLEVSLRSFDQDITALAVLRDNVTERFAAARTLLAEVHRTVLAGGDAHRKTLEKIAAPGLPDPLADPADLQRELDRAMAAADRGDWRASGRMLAEWTANARGRLQEAERILRANQAPLQIRNELRGRLDAYRAKAFRLGLLENQTVAGLYERAHTALYRAPTDLAGAGELVGRYQQAIAAAPAHTEVPREM